jgi:hypothetical protein
MDKKRIEKVLLLVALATFLGGCRLLNVPPILTPGPDVNQSPNVIQSPVIYADTFFTSCAYVDENANGLVDDGDMPIGGMEFTITLSGGAGFGAPTSGLDGCAVVVIPGGLSAEHWPIVAKMANGEGLEYIPLDEDGLVLEYPDTRSNFLFLRP